MADILHTPVLLNEVLEELAPGPDDMILDGTVGMGGHAEALLKASAPTGRLIGLDRDQDSLALAGERLAPFGDRVTLVRASYDEAAMALAQQASAAPITKILLDLGFSSSQLDTSGRGFSFRSLDEPLDMRYDVTTGETAAHLLATASLAELTAILRDFGEEPLAHRIAAAIDDQRLALPITKVGHLVDIVLAVYGRRHYGERSRHHPATRTFQALRIAVNQELDRLRAALPDLLTLLEPTGRLAIITFHSLEDRIVKEFFRRESRDCICPPSFPVCRCGHKAQIIIRTKHARSASYDEQHANPRSHSARLRVAEKRTPS